MGQDNRTTEGPYISAHICERVLQEKDGVNSLIRVVDTVHISGRETLPPGVVPATRLVVFATLRAYDYSGSGELSLVGVSPSGRRAKPIITQFALQRGAETVNIVFDGHFTFPEMGVYWFEFSVDNRVLTRLPVLAKHAQNSSSEPKLPDSGSAPDPHS